MNYWIEREKNDQLFFRFKGEEVRAIFTPKYKPVDNFEVLERLDSLGYRPNTEVQCHLDDEFMSLNIPDGEKSFSINGDRMTPGIAIANSEVGLSALSVSAFILRLVCTNGLIAKTEVSASYRHVSTRILEEFPAVVHEIAYKLDNQRDRLLVSHETRVDDPLSTIDSLSKQFGLKEEEREAVTWAMEYEGGDTMFAIINTYTRAAQFPGLKAESSYNLQKVAGYEIYLCDLTKEARIKLLKEFQTTEKDENWDIMPLAVIERERELDPGGMKTMDVDRVENEHMEEYIRERTVKKYEVDNKGGFDLMSITRRLSVCGIFSNTH